MRKTIQEVQRRFPHGLPQLDPAKDMKIKEEEFLKIVKVWTLEEVFHLLLPYPGGVWCEATCLSVAVGLHDGLSLEPRPSSPRFYLTALEKK